MVIETNVKDLVVRARCYREFPGMREIWSAHAAGSTGAKNMHLWPRLPDVREHLAPPSMSVCDWMWVFEWIPRWLSDVFQAVMSTGLTWWTLRNLMRPLE